MPLMSYQNFASIFMDLPPVAPTKRPRQRGPHGFCWMGESGTLLPIPEARAMAYRLAKLPDRRRLDLELKRDRRDPRLNPMSEDNKPKDGWQRFPGLSVPEEDSIHLLQSPNEDILFAVLGQEGDMRQVFHGGRLLSIAVHHFSVSLDNICGQGNIFHPFEFEIIQSSGKKDAQAKIAAAFSSMKFPSALWAICSNTTSSGMDIASFVLIDEEDGPLREPECTFSTEASMFAASGGSPLTVCLFWWHGKPAGMTARTRKTVQVRVQVAR